MEPDGRARELAAQLCRLTAGLESLVDELGSLMDELES